MTRTGNRGLEVDYEEDMNAVDATCFKDEGWVTRSCLSAFVHAVPSTYIPPPHPALHISPTLCLILPFVPSNQYGAWHVVLLGCWLRK